MTMSFDMNQEINKQTMDLLLPLLEKNDAVIACVIARKPDGTHVCMLGYDVDALGLLRAFKEGTASVIKAAEELKRRRDKN